MPRSRSDRKRLVPAAGEQSRRSKFQTEFGAALARQLAAKGINASELARRADVSAGYVSHTMTGQKPPPAGWVDIICSTMQLSKDESAQLHTAAALSAGYKLDLTKK